MTSPFSGHEATGADPDQPYARVVHLDAENPDWAQVASRRGLRTFFVLWRSDRAVGQVWVAEREEPTVAVEHAIAAAPVVEASTGPMPPPSTVSVVICTRDRPEALERCLASIGAQSRQPDELIVVDNASRGPETREVTLAAGAAYIREDRPGLDIARNTGLLAATSDVVAYTDDDTELHPRWLEHTVASFDDEHILAVAGLVLPAELSTEAQWLFERDWGFGKGYVTRDFGPAFYEATRGRGCPAWDVGAGANMAFRASVVHMVGLFDERLDVGAAGCSGDSEYWYRILAAGGTCRYAPAAIVFHHHRRDLPGLSSQIFHYMRGHAAALLVQYERTGDKGNLRRLFVILPIWYVKLCAHYLTGAGDTAPIAYVNQVLGLASGVTYYIRGRLRRRGTRRGVSMSVRRGGETAPAAISRRSRGRRPSSGSSGPSPATNRSAQLDDKATARAPAVAPTSLAGGVRGRHTSPEDVDELKRGPDIV